MASFTVTNLNDSGSGSLRDAITLANATPGADTITFDSSLTNGTITLSSGELGITESLQINGDTDSNPATQNITVSGNNASRVFNITDGNAATFQNVTIDGLTVTGGVAAGVSPNDRGWRHRRCIMER